MDNIRLVAPIVTPFTDDGSSISEVRLARLMRYFRESGFEGVAVATPAGEFASLSLAERKKLLEWVIRDCGKLAVYVNVTAQTTAVAIDLCQDAADSGATGAILCPPPVGQLSPEEAKNFVTVVRRHGNLAVGFIDPTGKLTEAAPATETSGSKSAEPLSEHGFDGIKLTQHGGSSECWTPSGVIHPVAMFGKENAEALLSKWGAYHPVVDGLVKHFGLARAGKYAAEKLGIETGPLRGPFMPINPTGREMVDRLFQLVQ